MQVIKSFVRYFDAPKPQFARNAIAVLVGLAVATMIVSAFTPSKAHAANLDSPVTRAQAAAENPTNPWTGFHIDGIVGMAASSTEVGGILSLSSDGAIGGLGLGYDYQFPGTHFVVGVMADYIWPDLSTALGPTKVDLKGEWSVAGRAGVAISNKALVYVLAGFTQSHASATIGLPDKFDGKVVGGGIEALVSPAFSVGLEYRAIFYDAELTTPALGAFALDPSEHQLRLKGSWRFNLPK